LIWPMSVKPSIAFCSSGLAWPSIHPSPRRTCLTSGVMPREAVPRNEMCQGKLGANQKVINTKRISLPQMKPSG
jgi:hypothetical protein